jgi:hypothetical protein
METGIMMFKGSSGVCSGTVEGTITPDRIAVKYVYMIGETRFHGEFVSGPPKDEQFTGTWKDTDDSTGEVTTGEATLASVQHLNGSILYGNWKESGADSSTGGRWTLDLQHP